MLSVRSCHCKQQRYHRLGELVPLCTQYLAVFCRQKVTKVLESLLTRLEQAIIGFLLSLIYSIEADKISRLMKFIGVSCYVIVMSLFLAYPLKMKD